MPQDLTALRETTRKILLSKIAQMQTSMDGLFRVCTPVFDTEAFIEVIDLGVEAAFTQKTGVGAPTDGDIQSYKSRSAPETYEKRQQFEDSRLLDMPSLAADVARICWDQAWNQINREFWSLLFSARTTAHPQNGVSQTNYAADGGGPVYAADDYDMTFIGGGTGDQTNDHTLALSSANISTLLAKRRTYKSVSGKADLDPNVEVYLCVAPGLETLARDLVAQVGRVYTGSGAESGYAGRIRDVIVVPADASGVASDAWGLLFVENKMNELGAVVKQGPVNVHVREVPSVKIETMPGTSDISVYAKYNYDVFYSPFPDQSWFYSEP